MDVDSDASEASNCEEMEDDNSMDDEMDEASNFSSSEEVTTIDRVQSHRDGGLHNNDNKLR